MPVKQISIRLENSPGKLSQINDYFAENGLYILALSVADAAADTGVVRLVANNPEKAVNVLKSHGFTPEVNDVLAVSVPGHPGGFNAVLKTLKGKEINVLYLYACLGAGGNTVLIVGVDNLNEAILALKKNWIQMYDGELYTFG